MTALIHTPFIAQRLAAAALVLACGPSLATITTYSGPSGQGDFYAAVDLIDPNPAVIDFFGDYLSDGSIGSNIARGAAAYAYSAKATLPGPVSDSLTIVNSSVESKLSTLSPEATITLYSFQPSVRGVGAYFFASDASGAFPFTTDYSLTLVATNASNEVATFTYNPFALQGLYVGFVSDVALTSLAVSTTWDVANYPDGLRPTVSELRIAAAPVPEPQTYALMLAGLGMVGFMGCRRRQR